MENKIAILTSGHPPMDERIYWKFARSLAGNGYRVLITASTAEVNSDENNILINSFNGQSLRHKDNAAIFYEKLCMFKPDLIICCEPFTILPAHKYKKRENNKCRIISDITEWYPHQNTLNLYKGIARFLKWIQLSVFNIYATNLADTLSFGEELKAEPYKYLAPYKKRIIIGYYPSKKIFNCPPVQFNGKALTLCYTGSLSAERGFYRFIHALKITAEKFSSIYFRGKIIGNSSDPKALAELDSLKLIPNITIDYQSNVKYDLFPNALSDVNICIDLRDKSIVFNRSLPIKIFDYMACGKPVIFTALDSLAQIPEIDEFCTMVDPDDINAVAKAIGGFVTTPGMLNEKAALARRLFDEKYNWELAEEGLINLVRGLIPA